MNAPRLLPVLESDARHGSRSLMTCRYRCGNACDHTEPNTSGNPRFDEILGGAISRRSMLMGGAAGAAGGALVLTGGPGSLAAAALEGSRRGAAALESSFTPGSWSPVEPNKRDALTVPVGYRQGVIASWGDPVVAGAPAFDADDQTPEAQALQFGYNCDYVGVVELGPSRAVMTVNHEYTNPELMFPVDRYTDEQKVMVEMAAHGMSILELRRGRREGQWKRVRPQQATLNRRLTVSSEFILTGPAAGDERLRTSADPRGRTVLGTLNNCSGGTTPWSTTLSGEENFNQYFDASGALDPRYVTSYARYGITGTGSRGWSAVDPRFDLTTQPHEPFRFGWIVEVDVLDPTSAPRKRTMLGRFKHEGANCAVADDGRVVVYMGDDERGDYMYKFVSREHYRRGSSRRAREHNLGLLDAGTLYVARFSGDGTADGEFDGSGDWIPLTSESRSYVAGFSVSDVLINTRLAADAVQPTRMDRPEDVQPNPVNGRVYCALTNNSQRGTTFPVDEANPLATSMVRSALGAPLTPASGNRNGYVLELDEPEITGTRFLWNLMLVCGDPEAPETYFAGFPKQLVSPISCPDNVAFDAAGNLWISTDGNVLGSNDGLFVAPVAGRDRGRVEQFLTVPLNAETCGPLISTDQKSVFVAVQHPGEASGSTFENPTSTWPHTGDFPRPSVVCVYREGSRGGGTVGREDQGSSSDRGGGG